MTTLEIQNSLTPEQHDALLAVRDQLLAANQTVMEELTVAHATAMQALTQQVAEKDAQNVDLTAKLETSADALTTAQTTIEWGKKLILSGEHDKLITTVTEAAEADKQKAAEAAKSDKQKAIEAAQADLAAAMALP